MDREPHLVTRGGQPTHRRIFEGLRDQIRNGQYVVGTQLPGTRELAANWNTSIFTVHTALRALAKEGWIDRRPNAGTYIADPRARFLCAGIYHASAVGAAHSTAFIRYLHFALIKKLELLGKTTEVFSNSRPENEQQRIFLPLAEAVAKKRIQCLIAPQISNADAEALTTLSMPCAFIANGFSRATVDFDTEEFFRTSAQRLAAQGCKSVGIISNVTKPATEHDSFRHFYSHFHRAIEESGLTTRAEWIRRPDAAEPDLAGFGYREFKALWNQEEKPDALIIMPDTVAQGAIVAALEIGINVVPARMKFVLHRNAHLPYLCPIPVTWAISDEDTLADALIDLVQKQFAGSRVQPTYLAHKFEEGPCLTAHI